MITIVILSFFLDAVIFSTFHQNTLLCPLFSMLSLIIIYPTYIKKKKQYLEICGILGIFYDICFANTLFLHVFLFIGLGYLVLYLFKKFSVSVFNTYWIGISSIVLYRILHGFFFIALGFAKWSLSILIKSILSSIILNSIYLFVFYFIAKKIRIKLRNQKYKLLKVKKSE